MKRWLLMIVFALSLPALAQTYTQVQAHISGTCTVTSQTCTITISSIGSGHLVYIGADIPVTNDYITAVSDTVNTFTMPSGCQGTEISGSRAVSCAYVLSATSGGSTTLTVTRTTTTSVTWKVWMLEASYTGTASVDSGNSTGAVRDQSTTATSVAGVTLTINGSSDIIFQTITSGSAVSSIAGGTCSGTSLNSSGAFLATISGNLSFSVCGNTTSGTAPTWTTVSGKAELGAIAFSLVSSALAAPTCSPTGGVAPQTVTCTIVGGATGCYTLGPSGTSAPTAPTPGTCGGGSTTYSTSITVSTAGYILQILATEAANTNSTVTSYTYGGGTTFTAVQSGEWTAATTWGTSAALGIHVTYPGSTDTTSLGDQVVIPSTFTVTCGISSPETCSAGNSPANQTTYAISVTGVGGGGLTCSNSSTIIYSGPVNSATGQANIMTAGAGCTIQHDSSWAGAPTTAAYTWVWLDGTSGASSYSMVGTSGSHITWQGDSYYASTRKSGACTTAGSCLSGAINFVTGSLCPANVGYGTFTYVDFKSIGGTTNGTVPVAYCYSSGTTTANGGATWTNVTFTNSGNVQFSITSTTDANNIIINGLSLLGCTATSGSSLSGCLRLGGSGANQGAGSYSITGLVADGPVNAFSNANDGSVVWKNAFLYNGYASCAGATCAGGGFLNPDGGSYDQIFIDQNFWVTGNTPPNYYSILPPNLSNSLCWADLVANSTASNTHFVLCKFLNTTIGNTATSYSVKNNVMGGLGSSSPFLAEFATTIGGTGGRTNSYTCTGNVDLPGYNGYGTAWPLCGVIDPTIGTSLSILFRANTVFSAAPNATLGDSGKNFASGALACHTTDAPSGTVPSVDSNLWANAVPVSAPISSTFTNSSAVISATNSFVVGQSVQFYTTGSLPTNFSTSTIYYVVAEGLSGSQFEVSATPGTSTTVTAGSAGSGTQTVTSGNSIAEFEAGASCGASSTYITYLGGNAAFNYQNYWQQFTGLNYIGTLGTDHSYNRFPIMVETNRSIPFFDVEYAFPEGIMNSYCASTASLSACYGAQATVLSSTNTGVTVTAGQVYPYSDPSVYGGRTMYFRALQSFTTAATNLPVLAFDASNPYEGSAPFWEEAYFAWMQTAVLANTTYDSQCAGLLFPSCPSPHTYAAGLLNAWIREGMIMLDPSAWAGGTAGCVQGSGGIAVDCGAVPLTPIQHIAPPASTI